LTEGKRKRKKPKKNIQKGLDADPPWVSCVDRTKEGRNFLIFEKRKYGEGIGTKGEGPEGYREEKEGVCPFGGGYHLERSGKVSLGQKGGGGAKGAGVSKEIKKKGKRQKTILTKEP